MKCPKCGKDLKCAECGHEFEETDVLFQGPATDICPILSRPISTSLGKGHGTSHAVLQKIPCLGVECIAWKVTGEDEGECKLTEWRTP